MKVRALTQVFLENVFYKEGQVFEYYGTYNRHLEPVVTHDGQNWVPMSPVPADWKPSPKQKVPSADAATSALLSETEQLAERIVALEEQVRSACALAQSAANSAARAADALQEMLAAPNASAAPRKQAAKGRRRAG